MNVLRIVHFNKIGFLEVGKVGRHGERQKSRQEAEQGVLIYIKIRQIGQDRITPNAIFVPWLK